MQIRVYLTASRRLTPHEEGIVRLVDVPDSTSEGGLLNAAFYWGQNDFQPQQLPSVSVGDVVELPNGELHRVASRGFKQLPQGADPLELLGEDAIREGYGWSYRHRRNPKKKAKKTKKKAKKTKKKAKKAKKAKKTSKKISKYKSVVIKKTKGSTIVWERVVPMKVGSFYFIETPSTIGKANAIFKWKCNTHGKPCPCGTEEIIKINIRTWVCDCGCGATASLSSKSAFKHKKHLQREKKLSKIHAQMFLNVGLIDYDYGRRRNPWTASDVKRFNKSCASRAACRRKWPSIANAVLRDSGDKGKAIRIASWQVKRMGLRRRNPYRRYNPYSYYHNPSEEEDMKEVAGILKDLTPCDKADWGLSRRFYRNPYGICYNCLRRYRH